MTSTFANDAELILRRWLGSQQGYDAISLFTGKKVADTRYERILSTTASVHIPHDRRMSDRHQVAEEIAHDFISFLLSECDGHIQKQPAIIQTLRNGHYRLFLDLIWNRFIWRLQEKARNKNENPIGYLYRRFRETINSEPEFLSHPDKSGMLYFTLRRFEGTPVLADPPMNSLTNETYQDWPSPPEKLGASSGEDIRVNRTWLVSTALFFWTHANASDRSTFWFAVKEIVRYLGTALPWLRNPETVSAFREDDAQEASLIDSIPATTEDMESRVERLRQIQSLNTLAIQLVQTWSREECCVFAWRIQDTPHSFAKIAVSLSLKDHNQAYNLFIRARNSIKNFCSNWPGPPLDEMEEDVAEYFLESVRVQAKNICSGP